MFNLSELKNANRLLFTIPLRPIQTDRFQPTGFPNLGAATYQTKEGQCLLVESAQSMANRLEKVCWDEAKNKPIEALDGISHVTVKRDNEFLTDTMLESHRLNSAYLLEGSDKTFFEKLKADLGDLEFGPINRKRLAEVLLKYDVGSLIHGVFLAKKELAGGRLRVARSLSSFIEATNVCVAASGGVKNDHVHPSKVDGDTKNHFGNIPYARDEFTADSIDCHINLDLTQIRGYGLGEDVEQLLIMLSLHRIRRLLDSDLRLRTACDLEPIDQLSIKATRPEGFDLPSLTELEKALPEAIRKCSDKMMHETVPFNDELKKAKESKSDSGDEDATDDEQE